jgi:ABC-type nitrate/sulfonate/bicarbonate transport system substrate-binding protein
MSIVGFRLRVVFCAVLALVAGGVSAQSAETIRIITTGKGSALEWPLFVGMEKGFFKSRDIALDLISAPSTSAAMQQVTAGAGEMGQGGVTDPMRAIDRGAKLSFLMLETSVPPYSIWAKAEIKKFADLKKKMVIVGGAKDITRIYFERIARPNGLPDGEYDLTYAGTTAARYAALVSGAVDAAILYPPATFKAADAGYTKLGEIADYTKDMPFSAYVVDTAWAKSHLKEVRAFLQGMDESVKWFYDKANRAEAIKIMIAASGGAQSDTEKSYDYFHSLRLYPETSTISPEILASTVKVLADAKELDGPADAKRFIDPAVAALLKPTP